MAVSLALQGSLLDAEPSGQLDVLVRSELAGGAWVDHLPSWLPCADDLFAAVVHGLAWEQRTTVMYDQARLEPRLSAALDPGRLPADAAGVIDRAQRELEARYGAPLGGSWVNLYRDGRDSVAWHGDRHGRDRPGDALVAIVSLGERRPLLLRPLGGGRSQRYPLGRGDLLVMGGSCQRTWQHCVPKVAHAGPRISITWRWPT